MRSTGVAFGAAGAAAFGDDKGERLKKEVGGVIFDGAILICVTTRGICCDMKVRTAQLML